MLSRRHRALWQRQSGKGVSMQIRDCWCFFVGSEDLAGNSGRRSAPGRSSRLAVLLAMLLASKVAISLGCSGGGTSGRDAALESDVRQRLDGGQSDAGARRDTGLPGPDSGSGGRDADSGGTDGGTTGVVRQGAELTIHAGPGEDFGSMDGEKMVFDDFGDADIGSDPVGREPVVVHGLSGFRWESDWPGTAQNPLDIQDCGMFPNSQRQVRSRFSSADKWSNPLNMDLSAWPIQLGDEVYVSLSMMLVRDDPSGGNPRQFKWTYFRDGQYDLYMSAASDPSGSCGGHDDGWRIHSGTPNGSSAGLAVSGLGSMEHLIRVEWQVVMNSTPAGTDGLQRGWVQIAESVPRQEYAETLNQNNMTTSSLTLARIFAGYYSGDGCPVPFPAANWYATNIYISSTLRRVEIGNADTYASSTIREPQPFLSWSAREITVRLNLGRLPSGPAWVYVLDHAGQPVNEGYPLTVP